MKRSLPNEAVYDDLDDIQGFQEEDLVDEGVIKDGGRRNLMHRIQTKAPLDIENQIAQGS